MVMLVVRTLASDLFCLKSGVQQQQIYCLKSGVLQQQRRRNEPFLSFIGFATLPFFVFRHLQHLDRRMLPRHAIPWTSVSRKAKIASLLQERSTGQASRPCYRAAAVFCNLSYLPVCGVECQTMYKSALLPCCCCLL